MCWCCISHDATCYALTSLLAVFQAGLTLCLLLTTQSAEAASTITQLHSVVASLKPCRVPLCCSLDHT